MNWYKKAKFYGDIITPTSVTEQPRPVYVTLKDGSKKQIEDVLIVPETHDDFVSDAKKSNLKNPNYLPKNKSGWTGWSVAVKTNKGWETQEWFVNDWEAETWVQKRWPNG